MAKMNKKSLEVEGGVLVPGQQPASGESTQLSVLE